MNKIAKLVALSVVLLLVSHYFCYGDFVYQTGPNNNYLGYSSISNTATSMKVNNPSGSNSVFLTANLGSGYQSEFTSNSSKQPYIGSGSGQIECQQPFGNPTQCVSSCSKYEVPYGEGNNVCQGLINAQYMIYGTTSGDDDSLNVQGSNNGNLNYVFLDTLVNNSNSTYDIATTTAPLYSPVPGNMTTIAGALSQNKLSIYRNIYVNQSITLGSTTYPVTLLNTSALNFDNRFTLFPASQNNPSQNQLALKQHMANGNVALNTSLSSGVQTIILIPRNMNTSCQPMIFIGRDSNNNYYGLNFVGNYYAGSTPCCVDTKTNKPCSTDTMYWPSGSSMLQTNSNQVVKVGANGRLKAVISYDSGVDAGVITELDILPGLWYPGQQDFNPTQLQAPSTGSGDTGGSSTEFKRK